MKHPIGIFDSGYGGLTVMKSIVERLPAYDYLYLGDNARAPYGTRSFDRIYHYTLECVTHLFNQGCNLIILACNTASARALRSIQQLNLQHLRPNGRVLGIIRPTAEIIGTLTKTKTVGILGTPGTIKSESYRLEINKLFPELQVFQEACPMWVPLVEHGEFDQAGADFFVQKRINRLLSQSKAIDALLLACTHYPLLINKIKQFTPSTVQVLPQGNIVAESLADYLLRHPEIDQQCSKGGTSAFLTTDDPSAFDEHGSCFFGQALQSTHCSIG